MAEHTSAPATSLVKALRVLGELEGAPEAGRGVTEIAQALDLPKSAVHRLLVTFQEFGFVEQYPQSRRYGLGVTLARLGLRAADRFSPRVVARPHLEALAREMGETVFLGIATPDGVLIVDKVEHGQVLRIAPALGTVLPLHQTALGKVLLAFGDPLPVENRQEITAIQRQGYAVSVEEWMPDICCVAAPVRDGHGAVVAGIALALPRSRMPQPRRHDPFAGGGAAAAYPTLVPPVMATAERISAALI